MSPTPAELLVQLKTELIKSRLRRNVFLLDNPHKAKEMYYKGKTYQQTICQ